ncbi:zf-HC2 domain-containing protein, partial [bacterium]|nr:zf-HC2 domain-containing protein [bacterium]
MQRLRLWLAMMGMMLGRPFGLRMRSCREVVQLLSDYLDGELSLEPRRSL